MKITFLGTNGWYSSPTGDTPSILIETSNYYLVLDAGNGIYKLDNFITTQKPIFMFISHFHLDHTSGLHMLGKFDFKQGIDVFVGENRKKDFDTLVNSPFTVGYIPKPENIVNLKTEIRLHELPNEKNLIPFDVEAIKQHHAYVGHGYRFNLDSKIIAYTGDCGYTDEAKKLAKDADVLICECSNKKTADPDIWGHFDPVLAATLAKETNVKQLLLTHFGANTYKNIDDRLWAENEAKNIFPNVIAVKDLFEFNLNY